MQLDQPAHQGQADAQALLLGGVEGVEQAVGVGLRQAVAAVFDGQIHRAGGGDDTDGETDTPDTPTAGETDGPTTIKVTKVTKTTTGELPFKGANTLGVLTSLAWGDGLVDNPPGQAIARGEAVRSSQRNGAR